MISLSILFACAQSEKSQDTQASTEDSAIAASPTSEPEVPQGLSGTQPDQPLPAIDFVAKNSDGSDRGKEDLMGKVTVMWFFPAADTPG